MAERAGAQAARRGRRRPWRPGHRRRTCAQETRARGGKQQPPQQQQLARQEEKFAQTGAEIHLLKMPAGGRATASARAAAAAATCRKLALVCLALAWLCGAPSVRLARADSDANRLYEDLMMTYNRIVRPVQNESDRVVVRLGLKLSQLMDVNLKNQMMTINVWLNQEWSDHKLKWDPSEYGGIEDINLPAEQLWLPDIALYNSAEGYFAVSIMTKAKVRYDGYVIWNPPAIFRSSCQIDITYFPFDSQNCHLKFGSWTFGTKIDLRHINETQGTIERGTDLSEYYQNVEWDIMQASAIRNVIKYECCPNDFYPDVTFHFKLRRKPLFYTVNLILPCVGITFFSFLVFYLPSDSGEKVTLTISILVSLIFFLSVLIETIPSTSLAMPLLGKYLVFTMILITLSVCATVCVLNIHFRTPSTHSMPPWIKRWCMDILPKYLFMSVPQYQSQQANILPEQLIYLHNPAYANQAVTIPGQPSSVQQRAANIDSASIVTATHDGNSKTCCPATLINGVSSNALAASHHFHSNSQPVHQAGATFQAGAPAQGQRQPAQLSAADLISSSALQGRPASFLPYLQSEAARRLQVQRSRSSDRDNRSTSDNQPTVSGASTNNGGKSICDTKTSRPGSKGGSKQKQQQQQQHVPVGDGRRETPGTSSAAIRHSRLDERVTKSKTSSSKPFWRLFGRATKHDESTEQEQVSGSGEASRQAQRSSSTSSSSTNAGCANDDDDDDDYKHHRHFQARASICSNNLWRIGPTRRCSLAVPTANYPSYYRPLVQLHHAHAHNITSHGMPLSTISGGCLPPIPAHYHTHGDESSTSSEGTSVAAIGTLIGATAANILQPRQLYGLHRAPVRELEPLSSGGIIRSEPQGPYPVNAIPPRQVATPNSYQSDSQNTMPTPPPPLPPDFNDTPGDRSMNPMMRLRAYNRQPPVGESRTLAGNWQSSLENQPMAQFSRDSSTSTTATNTTAHYRQVIPAMQPVPQYLSMAESHQRTRTPCDSVAMLPGASSRFKQSHISMPDSYLGDSQQSQQQQQQQRHDYPRIVPVANHSFGGVDCSAQYLNIGGQQSMPRSRSTDHRLSTMQRDVSTNSLYSCTQGAFGESQMRDRPALMQQSTMMQMVAPGHQYQEVQSRQQQSIGRQLGQAYIQRLHRQPNIYSLHQPRVVPAFFQQIAPPQLEQPRRVMRAAECQLQQYHEPSIDMLRRSKSQTSLNRRTHAACSASIDRRDYLGQAVSTFNGPETNQHNVLAQEPANLLSRPQSEMRGRFYSTGCWRYEHDAREAAQGCCPIRGCNSGVGNQGSSQCPASLMRTPSLNKRKNYSNSREDLSGCRCSAFEHSIVAASASQQQASQMTTLSMLKLINEVDKAIQNAMFIAQHIDNLDEFESVKENWKYIAMVIDRIFLIVFLFACIVGTVAIFALVPWSYYLNEKPIDLQLIKLMALNLTGGETVTQGCHEL